MASKTTLGSRLKAQREKVGISQERLARQIDVTVGQVSRWERDIDQPRLAHLRALVDLFRCTFDDLLKEGK
jgi:transcriptional regulator with XRE-family HTH domain